MSELTITLLRLGYLVLLWLFVLAAIGVLRRDLYGTRIVRRLRREQNPLAAPAAAPPGAGQPDGRQGEPRPPIPRRDASPRRLVVTEGPLRGTTLPLATSAILIGRAPSCTLVLDDDYSSSRHARVYPEAGQWFVEDLGSTNGTFVDRRRVDAPTPVRPGSQIRVGQSTLELQR
ncbi:FHA domain-containing protein [Actinotalea sp. Marseille-Q4924]|uniref:FHA domain-containing protein FhaB/FipA n=1 Tax=Actinotalea sp. Marseille-Q4924 TaxID=2866571 RepID=UPI001CE47E1F|nr:FHA domain-containing protein [Actinotalea sp. Marseille-Q4924]